jgi:hypothetical protein
VPFTSIAGLKGLRVIEVTEPEPEEQPMSATAMVMSATKQVAINQRVRARGDIKFRIVILSEKMKSPGELTNTNPGDPLTALV